MLSIVHSLFFLFSPLTSLNTTQLRLIIWTFLVVFNDNSLYTWQRNLCDRNRFNEPVKAFQYHLEERLVRDFSCALGISSPMGIFLSKCSGIRLSVQYRVLLGKEDFLV